MANVIYTVPLAESALISALSFNLLANSNANVSIGGGSNGQAIITDGLGNLSWGNIGTGTVTNIATSGSGLGFSLTGGPITTTGTITLTVPNATSLRSSLTIGNVANLNLNGNGSTYLAGNGTFSVPAGSYSNSNVANYLPTYTGNINANIISATTGNLVTINSTTGNFSGNVNSNNLSVTNLITGGTANVTVVNGTTGNFSGAVNGNILTVTTANVTGNVNAGNVNGGNLVTANFISGNGYLLTGIGNANYANFAGNVVNSAQPNITSVGTLTSLNVSGNITAPNITANTGIFTGNAAGLTNIPGANVTGTVANATYALNAGNANIANTANFATTAGNANYANFAGNVVNSAQPNITSLGTLTGLTVSGTSNVTDLNVSGTISIYEGIENVALISPQSGTYNFDLLDGAIQYASANAANNVTLNFRGNGSVSTNTLLSNGKSITATYLMTLGANTAYVSGVQVDGVATTVYYAGGVSSIGLANSIVSYTYTIVKTNNATFTVLGSVTRYV